MNLQHKVALITGGGSGIGRGAALLLAQAGARVAVLGRTRDELDKTVKQITEQGGTAMALVADITDAGALKAAYDELARAWGRLDIVLANAGINGVWAPITDLTPEEWDQTLDVNLKGTFLTVKYALPLLQEQGGSIIITSSVNGTRMFSNVGASAYASSKAAQVAFAKMAALELAGQRIRVNVICPGAIESQIEDNTERRDVEAVETPVEFPEGQIPLTDGAPGSAADVGHLVVFLASDGSRHITGTEIWIDGGQSLLQG
jgi:NAD(P)-dependent dehydrogenase (short-subunit alcohol dehydrogenase family)